MFKRIIEFIFGDQKTKTKKKIDKKYKEAISFQRNGNIRMYSSLMSEIAELEEKLNEQ